MSVLHFIPSLYASSGGPTVSYKSLLENLCGKGDFNVTALYGVSKNINGISPKIPAANIVNYDCDAIFFLRAFRLFKILKAALNSRRIDLIHVHGIWGFDYLAIFFMCFLFSIPFVVSPRGTLDPWCMKQKALKKSFCLFFGLRFLLTRSSHFVCASELEYKSVNKIFPYSKLVILPNINTLPYFDSKENLNFLESSFVNRKTFLFIGRFSKVKGIDILLASWFSSIACKSGTLLLVGPDNEGMLQDELKKYDGHHSLHSVVWKGELYDSEKFSLLRETHFLVLPSRSENYGMVISEAIWFGVPVIVSPNTPWQCVDTHSLGSIVNLNVESFKSAFDRFSDISFVEWLVLRINCLSYRDKFSLDKVVRDYIEFYSSCQS